MQQVPIEAKTECIYVRWTASYNLFIFHALLVQHQHNLLIWAQLSNKLPPFTDITSPFICIQSKSSCNNWPRKDHNHSINHISSSRRLFVPLQRSLLLLICNGCSPLNWPGKHKLKYLPDRDAYAWGEVNVFALAIKRTNRAWVCGGAKEGQR